MSSSLLLLPQPIDLDAIEGVMEGVPHDAFSGWVWNTKAPEVELSVDLIGPGFFARLQANESRFDLADAGKRGGKCWFKTLVPQGMSSEAQDATFALIAGTSHRLRSTSEGSLAVDNGWLDEQPMALGVVVNAQRVRLGLGKPALSHAQVSQFVSHAMEHGFDLSQLVNAVASVL